jgi:ribosomal protein S18 acetylase RimI-like enzyme
MSTVPFAKVEIHAPADAAVIASALGVWRAANEGSSLVQHPDRLREWAAYEDTRLIAAYDGTVMIGMLLSMVGRSDDGAGPPVPGLRHLAGVAVLPERWASGVGRKLLEAALSDARSADAHSVTLWARRGNDRAERLFKSAGFDPTGRSQRDEAGQEMLHYELTFGDGTIANPNS